MGEKFKLIFGNDGTGEKIIDEPFGYNEISFDLQQNEDGHARDNSFNGGSLDLTFTKEREHYLEYLLFYFDRYKTEAKVKFVITIDGFDNIIGDLDFVNAKTDELEYFTCKVIEASEVQVMKRKRNAEVNLFSDKTLNKEPIAPVKTYNILVKAKADIAQSKWEQQKEFVKDFYCYGTIGLPNYVAIAPFNALTKGEINSSAGSLDLYSEGVATSSARRFVGEKLWIINATDNLRNIKVKITDFYLKLRTTRHGGGYSDGNILFNLMIRKGKDITTSDAVPLITKELDIDKEFIHNGGFEFVVDKLDRGDFLWVLVELDIYNYTDDVLFDSKTIVDVDIRNMNIEATAEQLAYNSITKGVRVLDACKQVTKSVSGLNVIAPDFDAEGSLYDNFLLNGSLLRRNLDVPFNLSLETISKGLKEFNADFETNDHVFLGLEKDFYKDKECFFFDETQFSEFSKGFSQKHAINIFEYKYDRHQSLKEKEQPNSSDTVHGEMKLLLSNGMAENNRTIDVGWIRDSFLLDEARKKAYEISKDTSYQNDTDIFILDCVKNDKDLEFVEATELYHEWLSGYNRLLLRSKDELNFVILGIESNSTFEIQNDANAGVYNIEKVDTQQLTLIPVSVGAMQSANDGKRYTKYKYVLKKEQVNYVSRTNEGLLGNGIKSLDSFANLRYSVKRNVLKYYQAYLATCNMANLGKVIDVNKYLHNGDCVINVDGFQTKENEPITPINPILSPFMYENVVFANVSMIDYITLKKSIRTDRGYIRTINNNGFPIKLYPSKMNYIKGEGKLTITEAYEKFEMDYIKITVDANFVIFNGNIKLLKRKWTDRGGWTLKDNLVSLFDIRGYRYFAPVFWHRISINGVISNTAVEFETRMKLIN